MSLVTPSGVSSVARCGGSQLSPCPQPPCGLSPLSKPTGLGDGRGKPPHAPAPAFLKVKCFSLPPKPVPAKVPVGRRAQQLLGDRDQSLPT